MEVIAKVKQEQSDHHKESLDVNHDKDVNMEVDKETDSNLCDNLGSSIVESDRKIKEENVKEEEPDLSNSCNSVDNSVVESDRKIKEENIKKEEPDLSNSCNDMNNSVVESDSKEENNVKREEPDLYSYTKLDDFTSEIFKIELGNLPNFIGYGQLRKLLNSNLKLHPRKVKAIGNPPHFAFITFSAANGAEVAPIKIANLRITSAALAIFIGATSAALAIFIGSGGVNTNEKDRDKALKELNGYQWKGKTLSAKKANPAADPMAKKRKAGESEDCSDPKKAKTEEPIELKLKNAVTPYWNIPYEEQLKMKEDEIHKFLQKLSKSIEKVNSSLKPILSKYRKENYYQCCPLHPIKRSPVTTAYRNKCEFTVGRHLYTKEKTVGFRLNSYKEGSMSVAEPDDCINISESMLKAVKSFQAYIRESDKDVYNPENHAGYWRQLTVRTSNNADVLIIIVMHPQSLSEAELEEEKLKLKKYYEEGAGSSCGITSIYFQLFSKKAAHEETTILTHLMGKKFMEETLLGMKFQVSPEAFFQINVPATEVLYSMVADLVNASSSATVLDICCGTGTISLCLAKKGAKVIGIEMCPEAVENARLNATNNGLPDVTFICGKAEDVIHTAIVKCNTSEIIAVVDPPRAGLHQKVLKAIRGTSKIKKLIYVSCNSNAAYTNFVDLCRTPSNNYRGCPFYPVQAMVVDMFPHTPHKELVMVFERVENLET